MTTGISETLVAGDIPTVIITRGWRRALSISVACHLLLLAFLLSYRPGVQTVPESSVRAPPHVVVLMTRRPTQQALPPTAGPAAEIPPEPQVLEQQTAGPDEKPLASAPLPTPVASAENDAVPSPSTLTPSTALPAPQGSLSPNDIQAAITEFSAAYNAGLTGGWLSACMRFRERYPTQDCPQQQPQDTSALDDGQQIAAAVFAGVTRPDRHRRLTESLLEENDRLQDLIEDGGVLGTLARDKYFLNREYVFYLNGNFNFQAWNFVKTSNASNGNLEFMRGFMQVICKPSPCIYDFTGIGAKPPASDPQDDIGADPR
jgi:hypothetical protein